MSDTHASAANRLSITISVLSLIAAVVFGPWAISSLNTAKAANRLATQSLQASVTAMQQAQVQNVIALWSLCSSGSSNGGQQPPINQTLCSLLYETHPFSSVISTVTQGELPPPPPQPPPPSLPPNTTIVTQEYLDQLVLRLTGNRRLVTEWSSGQLLRELKNAMPQTTFTNILLMINAFLLLARGNLVL
ncbi:hypothetical protein EV356DRAFT_530677 [Viridothelium virens]|uniref:Uncharacterized protein n=1 Tax=Viridothelium virens TaxID=1048519 RepID=A0A6A6HGU9_VIRVR|nr:hypothetical protein EV356DRAFT_530677 [Viridothelium virens]